MLAIDTLETARRYQKAGLTAEQAEAYTQILKDAHQESIENLATKDDLDHAVELLRKDMKQEIALVRKDMVTKDEFNALREEVALVRKDMGGLATKDELVAVKSDVRMTKFMVGIVLAGIVSLIIKTYF